MAGTLTLGRIGMAHPNENLVREAFAAFGRGDIEALRREYFAPGIRWHFPGQSTLAGHHEGVDLVAQMLARPAELSGGTHRIELHDVIGNDEHVVALAVTRAERAGRKLEFNVVHVFNIRDGKVAEAWTHHADLYAVDEFWA